MCSYRCEICNSHHEESAEVPELCPNCGTHYGPWRNLTKDITEQRAKTTTPVVTHVTAPVIKPRSTVWKTRVPKKKAVVPPAPPPPPPAPPVVPYSPIVPPSVMPSIPHGKAKRTRVISVMGFMNELGAFVKVISHQLYPLSRWPWILAAGIILLNMGKIFFNESSVIAIVVVTLFSTPSIFLFFSIDQRKYLYPARLLSAFIIILCLTYPVQIIIQKIKENQVKVNVQPPKKLVFYIKRAVPLIRNPEINSRLIETIQPFDSVIFTGNVKSNWLQVIHKLNTGWIIDNAKNWSMQRDKNKCRIIPSMQKVNLRDEPSVNGRIIRAVVSNEILTAIESSHDNKWIKVTDPNGRSGWIWKNFVVLF
jgi:hypothetical protein